MTKKLQIIKWLKEKVDNEKQLTNWHLNDDYLEFCQKFYPNIFNDKKTKQHFAKYCKILVDYGYINEAKRIGLGCGGVYDFGVKTQTIWYKRNSFIEDIEPNENQKKSGMKVPLLEHKYFKKYGKFFEKEIIDLLKQNISYKNEKE